MAHQKLYLDTSVPSAHFDHRKPERKVLTVEFWKRLKNFEVFISSLVVDEIEAISNAALRAQMRRLIESFQVFEVNSEIEQLADVYVRERIIPARYWSDALHIAVAVANNVQYLISWNFKHFVNVKTRQMVNAVNWKEGYGVIEIIAPPEL